jgi:hypothetical protein
MKDENCRMNKQLQKTGIHVYRAHLAWNRQNDAGHQVDQRYVPWILENATWAEKKASFESRLPSAFLGKAPSQTRWLDRQADMNCRSLDISWKQVQLSFELGAMEASGLARQVLVQYLLRSRFRTRGVKGLPISITKCQT